MRRDPDHDWHLTVKGYVRANHAYARRRPYRHRAAAARMLGLLFLPDDIEVHHINGRPWDFREENLAVMKAAAHRAMNGPRRYSERIIGVEDMRKDEWEWLKQERVSVSERLLRRMGWWLEEHGEELVPW